MEAIQIPEPVTVALQIRVLPQLLALADHVTQLVTALLEVSAQYAVLVPRLVPLHPLIGLPNLACELFIVLQHVLELSLLLGCRHGGSPSSLLRLARGRWGPLGSRSILSRSIGGEHQCGHESESERTH